jgi:ABC-type amino acid transport substrate-binding protein
MVFAAVLLSATRLHAQSDDARTLAPSGELRVAVTLSNSVLVTRNTQGQVGGLAIDIANMLASQLGVGVKPVPYQTIVNFNQSIGKDEWDVALTPRDLSRVDKLGFSDVLLVVEYGYVARLASSLVSVDDVDRSNIRVAVAEHSAADTYLGRILKKAKIVRLQRGIDEARQALTIGTADVYADSIQTAYAVANEVPGAIVLVGRFSSVPITIAVPKSNVATIPMLNDFIHNATKNGMIADTIKHANLRGVRPGR